MSSNGTTPITVVGNLTEDPELRFTPSGVAVAKFSVAVNRRTYDRQTNEWKESGTDFHRVAVWRQMAENVAETLTKGMRVIVVGDLKSQSWTDTKTNEKRSGWEIDASAVGPELAFATAKVTKTTRQNGAGAAPDDPWATASRTRPPASTPAPAGAAAGGYSDEPPF